MSMPIDIEGYLLKKPDKGIRKKWKKVYFEIIQFKFSYFSNEDKKTLKGVVSLQETNGYVCDTSKDDENMFLFSFSVPGHIYRLQASTKEEREKWLGHIAKWAPPGSKGKLGGKQIVKEDTPTTPERQQKTEKPDLQKPDLQKSEKGIKKSENPIIPNNPFVEVTRQELTEIPKPIWDIFKLESLILSENFITKIPPEIGILKTLRILNLSNNKITSIPESIGNLENLEELNLHANELTEIPESIGNLTKLELFWISQNKINKLPSSIGKMKSLSKLSVAYNNAGMEIPPELGECSEMSWLDISGNRYPELPSFVLKFTNLKVLEASNNLLKNLPEEFVNFKFLRELRLSHNKLVELPAEMGQLGQLQELEIAFNNLEDLPASMGNSPAFIQAHSNPFSKIPEDVVENGSGAIKQYLKKK